jgi:predicted phosphodiesterase
LDDLLISIKNVVAKGTKLVFLSGNHENRYFNIEKKYPDAFKGRFDFQGVVKKRFPDAKWIDYNTYDSYYLIGDCVFMHGRIFPANHAKKYAENLNPYKVVYGHLHSYQAYTIHNSGPSKGSRYAINPGCLTTLAPEWKKGAPNTWTNGFLSFVSDGKTTTPTTHLIENGRFNVGNKIYE